MAVRDARFGHAAAGVFGCGHHRRPTSVELAEIAIATAETVRAVFGVEPLVALLSFSTKGSAKHKEVDRVTAALQYIRERAPGLNVDGELQADAALVPAVGQAKSPGRRWRATPTR